MSDLNYSINVLSSCPCCGSTDVSFRFKAIEDKTMHSISCFGCSLQIGYFITREAAARVWNRRPEPPRVDVGEALDFLVSMAKDPLEHPQHGNTERAAAVIRAALKQPSGNEALPAQAQGVEYLSKDDQEQAVWQAIQDIKFGNKDDDKMIVANLHKRGFYIAQTTQEERG